jgi:hypothetical protein
MMTFQLATLGNRRSGLSVNHLSGHLVCGCRLPMGQGWVQPREDQHMHLAQSAEERDLGLSRSQSEVRLSGRGKGA